MDLENNGEFTDSEYGDSENGGEVEDTENGGEFDEFAKELENYYLDDDHGIITILLNKKFDFSMRDILDDVLERLVKYLSGRNNTVIQYVDKDLRKDNLIFIGDIHGNVDDLKNILDSNEETDYTDLNNCYFFCGDTIDRGGHNFETCLSILLMMMNNPKKVYYNRGNHEDMALSKTSITKNFERSNKDLFGEITKRIIIDFLSDKISVKNKKIQKELEYKLPYSSPDSYELAKRKLLFKKAHEHYDGNEQKKIADFYNLGINRVLNSFKDCFKYLSYGIRLSVFVKENDLFRTNFFLVHGGIGLADVVTRKNETNFIDLIETMTIEKMHSINLKMINEIRVVHYPESKDFIQSNYGFRKKIWDKKFDFEKHFRDLRKKVIKKRLETIMEDKKLYQEFSRIYVALHSLLWSDISDVKRYETSERWFDMLKDVSKRQEKGGIEMAQRGSKSKIVGEYDSDFVVSSLVIKKLVPYKNFGPSTTDRFLKVNKIDYIIRGHQPKKTLYFSPKEDNEGRLLSFRVHKFHKGRVITIHSNSEFFPYNEVKDLELDEKYGAFVKLTNDRTMDIYIYREGEEPKKVFEYSFFDNITDFDEDVKLKTVE